MSDKRQRIFLAIILIILVASPITCCVIEYYKTEKIAEAIYVTAETLIWEYDDFEQAKDLLETIEIDYKDKEPLIVYCQAKIDYLNGNIEDAFLSQDDMIFGYQTGEHLNRLRAFKEVLDYEYDEYLDEKYPDKTEETPTQNNNSQYKPNNQYKPSYNYKPSYDDDPYDIDRYRNEEDFYYDNYNNFIDYYEAEKYFKEHKK